MSSFLLANLLWASDSNDGIDEAFLLFLGQWQTQEGDWLPPDELARFASMLDASDAPGAKVFKEKSGMDIKSDGESRSSTEKMAEHDP